VAGMRDGGLGKVERASLLWDVLMLSPPPDLGAGPRARLHGVVHSRDRDARAVSFHYDVGNDFYRLFLDAELVYSCGYFHPDDPSNPAEGPAALDRAQVRKLELVCRKLRLRPGNRLLDIGCGWGSLVLHAARQHGVHATGITLSEEQAALAGERVRRAGLGERVEIRVEDYRDVAGSFDAVASIGMFEHVGERRFGAYFGHVRQLLRPGGRFLNHAITTGRRSTITDLAADDGSFVGSYVFPDGCLAPAHIAVEHVERAGFELIDVQQLRPHYARTLRHWLHNLEANAGEARAVVGETIYRIWRAYMAGSVVGFETGDLGVVQILGTAGRGDLPLGRAWMEPSASS
jgi:cyclopropane-fatty-acyl-phospholipid synthase